VSAQSISTAFVTFGAGILSDRISSRILVSFGLILCGFSTLFFPFGSNVTHFSILWFINGIGQGFSLPSILKVTKENSHPTRFATNWSIVLISVNVSGVINPLLSAYITKTYNWRTSLFISALMSLTVGLVSFLMIKEPIDDRSFNKKNDKNKSETDMKTIDLLKFPILWMCIICRFIVAISRVSVSDWSQLYLINEKDIDIYVSSSYVSLVEVGGIFGKLIAGRISDLLMKKSLEQKSNSSPVMTRLPVSIAMMAINAFALHLFCFNVDKNSSVLFLSSCAILMGVTTAANIVNFTVIATEISSKKFSGFCSSLVNLSAKGILG
jgi:OPA family glycerol-6-phosphate transporter-like MFS transporter 4